MDNILLKNCAKCGKALMGRSDKKFCDAYCRNAYNNQNKAEDERYIQRINSLLRKNRRILKDLCPQGKATVRKEVLDQMGYKYQHFSGVFKSNTSVYYLVYDYGFSPISQKGIQKALIVQRQAYMDQQSFMMWTKPKAN